MTINYMDLTAKELKEIAKTRKVANWWTAKKGDLAAELLLMDICEAKKEEAKVEKAKEISKQPSTIKTSIKSKSFLLRSGATDYTYTIGDKIYVGQVADLLIALEEYGLNYVNTKCYKETGKYIVTAPGKKLIAALESCSTVYAA